MRIPHPVEVSQDAGCALLYVEESLSRLGDRTLSLGAYPISIRSTLKSFRSGLWDAVALSQAGGCELPEY